jgi:head-tail adaptor
MAEFTGRLKTRLILEKWAGESDSAGSFEVRWEPVATVWAEMVRATQSSRTEADSRVARVRYRATIRARTIDMSNRVVWRNKVLSILNVNEDPAAPHKMELLLEERSQ